MRARHDVEIAIISRQRTTKLFKEKKKFIYRQKYSLGFSFCLKALPDQSMSLVFTRQKLSA